MDVFFEQIISVRRAGKDSVKFALSVAGAVLVVLLLLFLFLLTGSPFIAVFVFGAVYFSFKFLALQNVEYEYIITNGTLDIDKIMGKAKRARLVSFDCTKIEEAGEYKPNTRISANYKKMFVCCNLNDKAYYIVGEDKNAGKVCVVLSPNEKLSGALNKYIPRTVANNLFGDKA